MFFLILLIPIIGLAQEDKNKNDYQKSFDEFSNSIKQDFNTFKSKNDSIFYGFLKKSWQTFILFEDTRPSIPKPIAQPVSDTATIHNKEIKPIKRRTMLQDTGRQLILNGKPTIYKNKNTYKTTSELNNTFEFYGLNITIPDNIKPTLSQNPISNNEIALYFKNASNNDELINTINTLSSNATKNNLNGWGYLELLKSAAAHMYSDTDNQILFSWYALLSVGYDAKVGYNNKDVFLLVAFDIPVYYMSYFELNNKKYYLVLFDNQNKNQSSIKTYQANYSDGLSNLSLFFKKIPEFNLLLKTRKLNYKNQQINISYNANLTDYYSTYPDCELTVYFQPPLSEVAISSMSKFLLPHLKNTSNAEKVNFMLDFIQQAIDYETDEKQFGHENYLFAEETICYPYADCEDRSVLLSQLVVEFTGLSTIAIVYPGHVLLGVNIKEDIPGSYVEYDNDKYYVADPTYIGAKLGMIMPEFEDAEPEIIIF